MLMSSFLSPSLLFVPFLVGFNPFMGAHLNPLIGAQLGTPQYASQIAADIARLTAAANLRSEALPALGSLYRTQALLAGPMIAYGRPWQLGQIANPAPFLNPLQTIATSI
jgi:hypothetical protein